MQDTNDTPKKRGRPATGTARTGAQRSEALRERARTLVFDGGAKPLEDVADTRLLEAFGLAYRARLPFEVERIAGELVRRLGQGKAVAGTVNDEPLAVAGTEIKSVAGTQKDGAFAARMVFDLLPEIYAIQNAAGKKGDVWTWRQLQQSHPAFTSAVPLNVYRNIASAVRTIAHVLRMK